MSAPPLQHHVQSPELAIRDALAAALEAASQRARQDLAEVERLSRLLAKADERLAGSSR